MKKDVEEFEILDEDSLIENEKVYKNKSNSVKDKSRSSKTKKKYRVKVGGIQIAIILLIVGLMISAISGSILLVSKLPKKEEPKTEEPVKEEKEEPVEEKTSFSFIAVGDALLHESVYYYANTYKKGSDGYYIYDFNKMLGNLKEAVKGYDVKFYNQETVIGGKNLGLSSYPCFNSPDEIGLNMMDMGFNVVNLASNHTWDKGLRGAQNSANFWHSKKDVLAIGSYESQAQHDNVQIMEANGITYAFLSYTYGTNGIPVTKGYEYLVNVWPMDGYGPSSDSAYQSYKKQVKKDVESIRDKVDVLFVSMHWGVEYQVGYKNEYQKDAAKYLSSLGVDVIVGTHPHVVQPVEYVGDTLVIYSLGNLVSGQTADLNNAKRIGGIVALNVNKTTVDGVTTDVSVSDVKADLLYTYHVGATTKVYRFSQLNNSLLYNYQSLYKTYLGYLNPTKDKRIQTGFLN